MNDLQEKINLAENRIANLEKELEEAKKSSSPTKTEVKYIRSALSSVLEEKLVLVKQQSASSANSSNLCVSNNFINDSNLSNILNHSNLSNILNQSNSTNIQNHSNSTTISQLDVNFHSSKIANDNENFEYDFQDTQYFSNTSTSCATSKRQRSRKGITNVKYHEEPVKIFKYGGINERDIAQRNAIDFVHSCPEHRAGKSHGNST